MKLNEEQAAEFEEAVRPLVKFLNSHCNPHMRVIVETNGAELVEGVRTVKTEEFITG